MRMVMCVRPTIWISSPPLRGQRACCLPRSTGSWRFARRPGARRSPERLRQSSFRPAGGSHRHSGLHRRDVLRSGLEKPHRCPHGGSSSLIHLEGRSRGEQAPTGAPERPRRHRGTECLARRIPLIRLSPKQVRHKARQVPRDRPRIFADAHASALLVDHPQPQHWPAHRGIGRIVRGRRIAEAHRRP